MNSDSKILYAFLLDRLSLSIKNHWVDGNKRIYLIFTREEVQDKLNLSDKTVTKAFKQLGEVKLVEKRRRGLGKPNLIYVGKIQHEEFDENEINIPPYAYWSYVKSKGFDLERGLPAEETHYC